MIYYSHLDHHIALLSLLAQNHFMGYINTCSKQLSEVYNKSSKASYQSGLVVSDILHPLVIQNLKMIANSLLSLNNV